jgi:hypothetical protein
MPQTLTSREATAVRARLSEPDGHKDLSRWARSLLVTIRNGFCVPAGTKHPLGFTCIQLYRGPTWGLCMHVWESPEISATLTTTPIHSHSWDLFSQVVCGQLENTKICVTDGSSPPTHRILEITSADRRDLVHATQRLVTWTESESVHISAGQNYELPAGAFHVSRPSGAGPTATVLLAEYRYASPELALGRLDASDHAVARQACLSTDVRQLADVTLRELTGDAHGEKTTLDR